MSQRLDEGNSRSLTATREMKIYACERRKGICFVSHKFVYVATALARNHTAAHNISLFSRFQSLLSHTARSIHRLENVLFTFVNVIIITSMPHYRAESSSGFIVEWSVTCRKCVLGCTLTKPIKFIDISSRMYPTFMQITWSCRRALTQTWKANNEPHSTLQINSVRNTSLPGINWFHDIDWIVVEATIDIEAGFSEPFDESISVERVSKASHLLHETFSNETARSQIGLTWVKRRMENATNMRNTRSELNIRRSVRKT